MIIGLCGYARVGKDTAFNELSKLRTDVVRVAFADELKTQVSFMLALSSVDIKVDLTDPKQKEIFRPMLVAWGKVRRTLEPNYWIDWVINEALEREEDGNIVVITDVRYLNEIEAIKKVGGIIFRLHRPEYSPANEEEQISFKLIDESEDPKDGYIHIFNNGSKEKLGKRLNKSIVKRSNKKECLV